MVCVSIQGTLLVDVVTDAKGKVACLWLCQTLDPTQIGLPPQ